MARPGGPVCISVINMKGGVGKTTTIALLARHAAQRLDLQVLAIDLDPQANLSQTLMGERGYRQFLDNKSPSIVEVFGGYQPPTASSASASALDVSNVVHNTSSPNLKVLPSRFDFSDNLISSLNPNPKRLAQLISYHFQDKDLILIDCAPTESIFTQAAYHASRYILVPVRPEFFATIGFPLLKDSLETFRSKNMGHQIDVIGIVINNATYDGGNAGGPEKTRAMGEIRREAELSGWYIFHNEFDYSRGFPKIMRGNYSYPGNAWGILNRFTREFFNRPALQGLQS